MNPDLPRLIPGILAIFTPFGYSVEVTQTFDDQIGVTLTRGNWSESRLFPFPNTNSELSIPLLAWKVILTTQGQP